MTESLLKSEAVTTLPPTAFKLLALLALGARGPKPLDRKNKGYNGNQAVTDRYARQFGFNSRDTVYRGLNALVERGLIIKTRDGHRSKTHFALYAVAWLPITHWDGQPLDTPKPAAEAWCTWKPEAPREKKKTPNRWDTKKKPSDHRTQSRPTIGHDEAICRPTVSRLKPICRPIVGNTSRVLGTPNPDRGDLPSPSAPIPAPNSPSKSRRPIFRNPSEETAVRNQPTPRRAGTK